LLQQLPSSAFMLVELLRQRRKEIRGFKVGVSQNHAISLMAMVK
jgi:hypothetical protein